LSNSILPIIHSVLSLLLTLFLPTLFAVLLYYVFRPVRVFLEKRKIPTVVAILFIFLALAGILSIIILYIWPFISEQIEEFSLVPNAKIKDVESKTIGFINLFNLTSIPKEQLQGILSTYIVKVMTYLSNNIIVTIGSIAQIATYIVITPFILFYLLKDDRQILQDFRKLLPKTNKKKIEELAREIDATLANYIQAQILVALFVGILIYIGYWIIGLHYPLLLAFFAFVFNMIPFCGPFISTIPALLIGLSQSPWMCFKVICVVIIIHLIDANLISPKLVGYRLNIHPVVIILLLLASFSLFGLLGVFLATPLYAILKTLALKLYAMKVVSKKE
jgi:predicted PurR-regulated permease PerM